MFTVCSLRTLRALDTKFTASSQHSHEGAPTISPTLQIRKLRRGDAQEINQSQSLQGTELYDSGQTYLSSWSLRGLSVKWDQMPGSQHYCENSERSGKKAKLCGPEITLFPTSSHLKD